ncbi:MAG: hypothetical protein V2I67_20670 [Thermoanaerobaculales bacterium]|jgi:hypothetical protein|nr:hypothetical protein [Thermoanaerobaculales bacterium]
MRAFFALVLREISERRALLIAGAVASVLPVLAPLLPATGGNPAADTREMVMWFMVGSLVPIFALLLGVSFIGRDLAEGRLGFYYSQPMSGPAIWFGKLTAVVLLVWGTQALIMLPTVVLAGDRVGLLALDFSADALDRFDSAIAWYLSGVAGPFLAPGMWIAPIGVLLIGHAVGVVWRGRSAWLVVDFVALIAVVAAAYWALRPFLPFAAPLTGLAGTLWLLGSVLLAVIAAGAWQLTFGRVDVRRAHRTLSAALWCVLGVGVAALVGWSGWVRAATPADLLRVEQVGVTSGDWIAVEGSAFGRFDYFPRLALNAVDGRWLRTGSGGWPSSYSSDVWFSGDGRHVFWPEPTPWLGGDLMVADLEAGELEPRSLGLALDEDKELEAISHGGERIAIREGAIVAVYDVGTGDQLAAVAITGKFSPRHCWFDGPGALVIEAATPWRWQDDGRERYETTTYRFDVASKTLTGGDVVEKHPKPSTEESRGTLVAQDRRRLARVESDSGGRLVLYDAETGEQIADLGETTYRFYVRDLGDGRFVVLRVLGDEAFVDRFDADGDRLDRLELGNGDSAALAWDLDSHRVFVRMEEWQSPDYEESPRRTLIVNLEDMRIEQTIDGVLPLDEYWLSRVHVDAWPGARQPGSVSSRLLVGEDKSLHLWNDDTGTLEQLIPVDG